MKVHSFSHVAITVADFNRTIRFYSDVFGAHVVGVNCDHDPERLRSFFGVDSASPELKIGWIRVPGGATIEVFEFQPGRPVGPATSGSRACACCRSARSGCRRGP